jgi:hypothetical protein
MDEDTRKEVKFFISYAHENHRLATAFINKFSRVAKPSKLYRYLLWRDVHILPGEKWKYEIEKALGECTLGLLLISVDFLGSDFITSKELTKFVGDDAKPVIPVMLLKVDLERHELKSLQEHQIYRLHKDRFDSPKAYSQCSSQQRDEFIDDFFRKVDSRLDKIL